ncbi:hypothetical protein ITI46_03025 [Streptomyces oryzae]|uniref:Uncharacterized protein n=1 Tax=Streptomyces oryzae TaxID=1434886 RepID=A0ABS3X5M1_9ACTN|nr:hypothetical protein [Streptomyces oryzae]MBO8190680.1 hypothetical protein [Streptomyces oryzae]
MTSLGAVAITGATVTTGPVTKDTTVTASQPTPTEHGTEHGEAQCS